MQTSSTIFCLSGVVWAFLQSSVVGQMAAVPPPPQQSTADCAHPVYATDQLVCADPELREMDRELRDEIKAVATTATDALIESDEDWFKRRGVCAFERDHRGCAFGAYRERLATFEVLRMSSAPTVELSCSGAETRRVAFVSTMAIFYDDQNGPLIVAFAPAAHDPWNSFATFTRKKARVAISFRNGHRVRCKAR